MSIFDHTDTSFTNSVSHEMKVLSAAIYEIYREADRKREELLKTIDKDVARYTLPSYRDLRKELFTDTKINTLPNIKLDR